MSSSDFEQAAADVENLNYKPNQDQLLELYALYKQAKFGNADANPAAKPSFYDMKRRFKFEAWSKQQNKSQEDARKEYINLVEELKKKQPSAP